MAKLLEKAKKLETESLSNLELRSSQAQASLQLDQSALLNERVVKGLLHKLEEAVTQYEHSVAGIFTAVGEDQEKKQIFADKLSSQMKKVNPLLDELYSIQEKFKAASASPAAVTNKTNKLLVTIQLKIRLDRSL